MKKIILLSLIFFSFSRVLFSQESEKYDYLTIELTYSTIFISQAGEEMQIIDVKSEQDNRAHDFRPILQRIQEYEKQGWKIYSNNITRTEREISNYFLLRKKRG